MQNLLLTLGHDSSAATIAPDGTMTAIQEERVSGVKGDSSFPKGAIHALETCGSINYDEPVALYITHWFNDFTISALMATKYYDAEWMNKRFKAIHWMGMPSETFTHHDAHMFSANHYFKSNHNDFGQRMRTTTIVMDGFGNHGEMLSVYQGEHRIFRSHALRYSLGLFFQYATSYTNMKENQDEYKYAGYASKIRDIGLSNEQFTNLVMEANTTAKNYAENIVIHREKDVSVSSISDSKYGVNVTYLESIRTSIHQHLDNVMANCVSKTESWSITDTRTIIGWYSQLMLETTVKKLIKDVGYVYSSDALIFTGGIFQNVELNKCLFHDPDYSEMKMCFTPLCGDIGNSIGAFTKEYKQGPFPILKSNLAHIPRPALSSQTRKKLRTQEPLVAMLPKDTAEYDNIAANLITETLKANGIVNIVGPNMEFGPRSLCQTATIAFPTIENVERINQANQRNTIMPMAPVMTREMFHSLVNEGDPLNRSVGSHQHMICSYKVDRQTYEKIPGACHVHADGTFSIRPQVTNDPIMLRVLACVSNKYPALINTSFNFHGDPIPYTHDQALAAHRKQGGKFITVFLEN
tara:strand:- start:6110 stop:7852 length:1743 start_codon:yes stop_codon:yes gene_type:complete